jgi:hypothetical protein
MHAIELFPLGVHVLPIGGHIVDLQELRMLGLETVAAVIVPGDLSTVDMGK